MVMSMAEFSIHSQKLVKKTGNQIPLLHFQKLMIAFGYLP